jgi:hypothetical protein
MNGTTRDGTARSVQMAVLAARGTSIGDAVAEVRRRVASHAAPDAMPLVTRIPRPVASAAA